MTSQVVASSSAKTLADFQRIVQQQEGIFGPLIALSSQQGNNWIVLEENPVKPANRATLQVIQQEPAPAVPGSTVVCTGNCFVEDKAVLVAAYRKT